MARGGKGSLADRRLNISASFCPMEARHTARAKHTARRVRAMRVNGFAGRWAGCLCLAQRRLPLRCWTLRRR